MAFDNDGYWRSLKNRCFFLNPLIARTR